MLESNGGGLNLPYDGWDRSTISRRRAWCLMNPSFSGRPVKRPSGTIGTSGKSHETGSTPSGSAKLFAIEISSGWSRQCGTEARLTDSPLSTSRSRRRPLCQGQLLSGGLAQFFRLSSSGKSTSGARSEVLIDVRRWRRSSRREWKLREYDPQNGKARRPPGEAASFLAGGFARWLRLAVFRRPFSIRRLHGVKSSRGTSRHDPQCTSNISRLMWRKKRRCNQHISAKPSLSAQSAPANFAR